MRHIPRSLLAAFVLPGLAASPHRTMADTPGITLTTINTTYMFDRDNAFGWRFRPTRDIDITALGFFDATSLPGGTGAGPAEPHDVGIFRVTDQVLLSTATIPAGSAGTLTANFRYVPLAAPIHLAAGVTYSAVAFVRSTSPDPGAAASAWAFPPDIVFANNPLPTIANPASGASVYFVNGSGQPPHGLTFPDQWESNILPTFHANFQYTACYPNCDGSTTAPNLNVLDFSCFLNKFAAGDPYANCDLSTTPPVLNVLDFACFLNQFAAGCS